MNSLNVTESFSVETLINNQYSIEHFVSTKRRCPRCEALRYYDTVLQNEENLRYMRLILTMFIEYGDELIRKDLTLLEVFKPITTEDTVNE